MSMYDCAVCSAPRCEHVIEEMEDLEGTIKELRAEIKSLKSKSSYSLKAFHNDLKTIADSGQWLLALSAVQFAYDYVKHEDRTTWEPKTREITTAALSFLGELDNGITPAHKKLVIAALRVAGFKAINRVKQVNGKRTSSRVWIFSDKIKGRDVHYVSERFREKTGVPTLKDEEL